MKEETLPVLSKELCNRLLADLENARRPVLEAIKCSLDNAKYSPKVGFLTPGSKKVRTELNVASVQKMSRAIFLLEILLRNVETGAQIPLTWTSGGRYSDATISLTG